MQQHNRRRILRSRLPVKHLPALNGCLMKSSHLLVLLRRHFGKIDIHVHRHIEVVREDVQRHMRNDLRDFAFAEARPANRLQLSFADSPLLV